MNDACPTVVEREIGDNDVTRAEFTKLQESVDSNLAITKEVRDIIATFHVIFAVAKFMAACSAAVAGIAAVWHQLKGSW